MITTDADLLPLKQKRSRSHGPTHFNTNMDAVTCKHVCVRAYVCACMCACVHVCVRVCVHVCVHACMRACVYVSCVHVYVRACMQAWWRRQGWSCEERKYIMNMHGSICFSNIIAIAACCHDCVHASCIVGITVHLPEVVMNGMHARGRRETGGRSETGGVPQRLRTKSTSASGLSQVCGSRRVSRSSV